MDKMNCSKCGRSIDKDSRFCIYCGEIFYDNNQNEFLREFKSNEVKKDKFDLDIDLTNYTIDGVGSPSKLEKRYSFFSKIFDFLLLIFFVGIGLFSIPYITSFIKNTRDTVINDSKRIVEIVKSKELKEVKCSEDRYYYIFDDSKEIAVNGIFNTGYSGYVEVRVVDGVKKYYITLSNGLIGYGKTLEEELDKKGISLYFKFNIEKHIVDNNCIMGL